MDFVTILLTGEQLKITNELTGLRTLTGLYPISANIIAPTETTDLPQAGTSMQVVSVSANSKVSNMQAAKVIMPAHLVLQVVANDQSTTDAIVQAWRNVEWTFSITTRNIIASGMSLTEVDLDQTPENLNGVGLMLTFEQTSLSESSSFDPKQQADKSSAGVVVKEPISLTSSITSVYNTVRSKIGL